MKKYENDFMHILILAALIFALFSCSEEKKEVWNKKNDLVVLDSIVIDSMMQKATELIISTQNSYKKVEKIKQISTENITLKKELVETKKELHEAKLEIIKLDSIAKPKRNFIQKIVDNFKDTIK